MNVPHSPIAIITGATAGIGEAIARRFASGGYRLVVCGRRGDRLAALVPELIAAGSPSVRPLSFDITDRQATEAALKSLPTDWKQPGLLVNNAGLALGLDRIQEGSISDWDTMIDTNIKGLLYITAIVSRWMVQAGTGHIINIGSIAGREVYPAGNVYCATKFAVDALSKAMRIDLMDAGIRVSQIAPGAAETEFSQVRFKGDSARAEGVYQGFTPLTGNDIAEIAWWVARAPAHVNIADVLVLPTAQASAGLIRRS
ncbi:MAG TPA: SDR family NAD(P)-dependent oxidoreductase [Bacteroidales bacterium]|nr:SDR family NAD(P)-dependent oxidoreductase [Bacteroidales bacterium]HRZ49895.1 SDR family NAD(P)-dependent oxidoreductase [Bacteroidales bacterium]